MSMRDDNVSLGDMLGHAQEAVELLGEAGRDALRRNRVMQLALTRLVEIVGEAASRVSTEMQQRHNQLPWQQIVGMRNRLAHGYDVIDIGLLWDTVTTDLPPLIESLKGIVKDD